MQELPICSSRSAPARYKSATDRYVVLATRNARKVVCWCTSIEVASLASKGDPSPHVNVDTRAEIEDPASELSRYRIGLTITQGRTLLVVAIATTNDRVRRSRGCREKLQPNTRRDIQAGEVLRG
jgi:hypothetical protein